MTKWQKLQKSFFGKCIPDKYQEKSPNFKSIVQVFLSNIKNYLLGSLLASPHPGRVMMELDVNTEFDVWTGFDVNIELF